MKTIGGIGYIFSIIPLLNFVAPIMLGIAWYQMGSKTRQAVFKATGVLMFLSFMAAVGFLVTFSAILLPLLTTTFTEGVITEFDPTALIPSVVGSLLVFVGFAVVIGVLGLAVFVLELVAHFRAAGLYGNRWFSRAAWMRITVIILILAVVGILIAAGGLMPTMGPDILSLVFLPIIPLAVVGLLSLIFSAVAFFTLEENLPPPHP